MAFQFGFEVLGVVFEMAVVFKSAQKFVTAGWVKEADARTEQS